MKRILALTAAIMFVLTVAVLPVSAYKWYDSAEQEIGKIQDGDLIYYEGFDYADTAYDATAVETAGLKAGNKAIMDLLGWKVRNIADDGALTDNSAKFSIVGGRLFIENPEGNDSYVEILSDEKMWEIDAYGKYTLQYDLEYTVDNASNKQRYIVMLLNYDGYNTYNSCHIRTCGYGNNQCRVNGSWFTYDVAGDYYTSGNDNGTSSSLISKLTNGATTYVANESPFISQQMKFTVRYQVDEDALGPVIYMRNNNLESGEFVKVSQGDISSSGFGYWRNIETMSHFALALKPSLKVCGYLDNIYVYAGLGDTPTTTISSYTASPMPDISLMKNALTAFGGVSFVGTQEAVGTDSMSVRFIGGVDSKTKYSEAGFTATMDVGGTKTDVSSSTVNVYRGINQSTATGVSSFYAYNDNADRLFTATVENVPKTGTVIFEVTPYTINIKDQTKTEADTFIVTYTNGAFVSIEYKK